VHTLTQAFNPDIAVASTIKKAQAVWTQVELWS